MKFPGAADVTDVATIEVIFDSCSSFKGCKNTIRVDVPENGMQCEHFWVNGGCGGHDAGRCGVTGDGGLYAYYLDAVAWCQDDNPVSAATVGLGCDCCRGSDGQTVAANSSAASAWAL